MISPFDRFVTASGLTNIADGQLWSIKIISNSLLGPAVGAFLIAIALPLPFAANALACFAAILLLLRIKDSFKPTNDASKTGAVSWP